jgi:N6-adenosine-specific RNA methylase IME4
MRPIDPAPNTTNSWSFHPGTRSSAWSTQAKGSTSGAARWLIAVSSGCTIALGTATSSATEPSTDTPTGSRATHMFVAPRRHQVHSPHEMFGLTPT